MNCQRTVEQLTGYMDGTLGSKRSAQIRDHLAVCERCRAEHEALRKMQTLLGALPTPRPRRDFWANACDAARLETALQAQGRRSRGPTLSSLRARLAEALVPRAALFATTGAALLLLAALTLPLSFQRPSSPLRAVRTQPAPMMMAEAISADSLIALHSQHGAGLPLADAGRMRNLN